MKTHFHILLCLLAALCLLGSCAQGNDSYRNPILNADYSDPDVIRVGNKYYMVASDFHFMGMQVLESDDMVSWRLISQIYDRFDFPGWDENTQYAKGAWAPSLRYHDGRFWMFVCTPEEGLLMSTAENPHGPWSPLHCVAPDKKWEDPCPLWDDDGQAYLARSIHGAGPIIVHKMSPDGKQLLDAGTVVYRGPVAEGPKWTKRNGFYYLLIPEGGVSTGWQTVLRSKNIYGPYEKRVVLEQGTTLVNGPHQGGLVDTPDGEWWFYHFQSTSPIGRVVHLQPASWTDDDWLTMGIDYDGNGIGEPVATYGKPATGIRQSAFLPATSDEFTADRLYWAGQKQRPLGLQWQWCHNPVDDKWSLSERDGWLTLHALSAPSLRLCRNMLTQKVMGYQGEVTTLLDTRELTEGTFAGLLYMGKHFHAIGATPQGIYTETDGKHTMVYTGSLPPQVHLRVSIDNLSNLHRFSYSLDGKEFHPVGIPFTMTKGYWKGTRVGLFCYNTSEASGTARFDWFRYDIRQHIAGEPSMKPRVLVSTDIGGTDPDDNQSMAHLLMYSNEFDVEGLVSSPSYGEGNKEEILRMIDLYEQDLPKLRRHMPDMAAPDELRKVVKQGRKGAAPACGYGTASEGSDWIVECARKNDPRPLYVLVWGGLDDVAQALHDAPDIADKIRVYWIGGPNKKWSVDSYVYLADNFPNLWFIENNASYRGFIYDSQMDDKYNLGYYDAYIKGAGVLGKDFADYYKGHPKMGDTPSLLYVMNGNPNDPEEEGWGGWFEPLRYSSRFKVQCPATVKDTVQVFSVLEFHIKGPVRNDLPKDSACVTLTIRKQPWKGYHLGDGNYVVRHSTYYLGTVPYSITSPLENFPCHEGEITVAGLFHPRGATEDYPVGPNWFHDLTAARYFWKQYQGAQTIYRWRQEVMEDWGERWKWLKE